MSPDFVAHHPEIETIDPGHFTPRSTTPPRLTGPAGRGDLNAQHRAANRHLAAHAAAVGRSYLAARDRSHDAVTVRAYQELQNETDLLLQYTLRANATNPIRIAFTSDRAPYASDAELIAAFRACRVLEVTTAATSPDRLHPLLNCSFGGAFDRFRALHDLIGHALPGLGFGLEDELAAWRLQDRMHGGLARAALATELLAINSAWHILGEAPPHKAVLLKPVLVRRTRALVSRESAWPPTRDFTARPGLLTGADRV